MKKLFTYVISYCELNIQKSKNIAKLNRVKLIHKM